MAAPAFTAEQSLGPTTGSYCNFGPAAERAATPELSAQIDFPPGWPFWPPYSPTGPFPTTPPMPPPPGWTYPPGWTPPYPGWTPPPGWPPPPAPVGVLFRPVPVGVGGTIVIFVGAAAVGTAIGYGVGELIDDAIAPDEPAGGAISSGCTTVGRRVFQTEGTYWGCDNSMMSTLNKADERCRALTGWCAGSCKPPRTCVPRMRPLGVPVQTPGFFTCDTLVTHTCECECT
jgi:hypothetical protein